MTTDLGTALRSIRVDANQWRFCDLRIDIPPLSYGSDAANPHTQYSNAIAILDCLSAPGIGASFTLGEGNDLLCQASQFLVSEMDGVTVGELMDSPHGLYETLVNPRQLRWLSPYAGLPMMAAGLILNTLLDAAGKRAGMPAWEYLARLDTADLLGLVSLRHLGPALPSADAAQVLDDALPGVADRCEQLRSSGLPVYYTTWIGHSAADVADQMQQQYDLRGIHTFKVKIGPDIARDLEKLDAIQAAIPADARIAVDANQTLSLEQAESWLHALSDRGILWLEEPFAPDNVGLFAALAHTKQEAGLTCEIATGENCPNPHTAASLIAGGLDRYQPDPCRMVGLADGLVTAITAHKHDRTYTPHAGGTGLDELSPHLQLLNLARVDSHRDPSHSLTENVGFCSRFYAQPTAVTGGRATTPTQPGLLVGLTNNVSERLIDYREGISWLEL